MAQLSWHTVCILLSYFAYGVIAVELSCTSQDTTYCVNDTVQYRCSIAGSDVSLRWRVFDDGNTQLGQSTYGSGDIIQPAEPLPGAADFTVVLISSGDPIVSDISFTANTSHVNYTVQCGQIGGESVAVCTINIEDPPSRVNGLSILSYTSTSVQLSWTASNSPCVSDYTISYTADTPNTVTTSQPPHTLTIPSDTMYDISVAATDTGGRTGPYSDSVCVLLDEPPIVSFTDTLDNGTNGTAIITITWTSVEDGCRPPILAYYIVHNATDDGSEVTTPVSSSTTIYSIDDVSKGTYVMVAVFAENVLGNGTTETRTIFIPDVILPPPETSTTTSTISVTPTMTPTSSSGGLSTGAGIGIGVGVAAAILLAIALVLIIAVIVYKKPWSKGKNSTGPADESQMHYADLEMSSSSQKSSKKASSKKKTEQAPPTDNTAVVYSDVSHSQTDPKSQQTVYADLALDNRGSGPRNNAGGVEYSDIRRH